MGEAASVRWRLMVYLERTMADATTNRPPATSGASAVRDSPEPVTVSRRFSPKREEVLADLKLIIRLRFIVSPGIFIILAGAGSIGLSQADPLSENQLIVNGVNVLVLLALNLTYLQLLKRLSNIGRLIIFQLFVDVIHFSLTIYKTGGVVSPFSFLYFMVIFSASLLVSGRATWLIAGVSAIAYSAIGLLESFGLVNHQSYFSPLAGLETDRSFVVLVWSFSLFSFFIFAVFASYLTGLIRRRQRELARSNADLDRQVQTLELLSRTSNALNHHQSVREVAHHILGELLGFLGLDRALLYLNADDRELQLLLVKRQRDIRAEAEGRNAPGDPPRAEPVKIPLTEEAGVTARAALRRVAYNITDPENTPGINAALAKKIGMNPFAVAPMVVRDHLIGVIGIDRSAAGGPIADEEFRVLRLFANAAAMTIDGLTPRQTTATT